MFYTRLGTMANVSPRKMPTRGKRVLPNLPLESPRLKVVTFNDNTTETSIGGTQKVGKIKEGVLLHFESHHKTTDGTSKSHSRGGESSDTALSNSKSAHADRKDNRVNSLSQPSIPINTPEKVCQTQHPSSSGSESEMDSQLMNHINNQDYINSMPNTIFRTPNSNSNDHQPRRHTLESKLFGTPDCYRDVNLGTPRRLLPVVSDDYSEDGEDSCSIMVAVRVRPFAQRELSDSSNRCAVSMEGNQTVVQVENGTVHRFAYDFSFWSHDPDNGEFSDQETVYRKIAQPLLGKAFEGYNTCLFAYGQTGSGKSYSIMGHGKELGIIPRFCAELFCRADSLTVRNKVKVNVEISFYEIYNEKIHDLLTTTSKERGAKKASLKVREHPQMGPYVEGLSNYVVNSFEDVEGWITLGNKNRATATTAMNDKSSRSHSIFTIILTQTKKESIEGHEHDHSITSKINLVDLAGSERQSFANTSGERLREGANINRSLLTLGKVISLLSERSVSAKKRKMFIPYRDSVLTWLLKESLGGNSKTAMMATISPSSIHLEETLSTLRYAQQARSIVNVVRVNEDHKARIIRQLKSEIEKLRAEQGGGALNEEALAVSMAEVTRLKSEMEELSRSWQERLRQAEAKKAEELQLLERAGIAFKVDNRLPNLVNLNEDPQLSEMLLYVIKEGETRVGRKIHSSRHDIQLTGALIADNHCVIQNKTGIVNVTPIKDAPTYVNGNLVSSCTTLHHGDRVILGGDHFFRFNHPMEVRKNKTEGKGNNQEIKDFDYAKQELHSVQEERLQAELETELERTRQEMSQQKDGYENKLKGLEEVLTTVEQTHKEAQSTIHSLKKKNMMLEQEVLAGRKRQQKESDQYQQTLDDLPNRKSRIVELLESESRQMKEHLESLRNKRSQLTTTQEMNGKSTLGPSLLNGSGPQPANGMSPLGGRDLYKMALLLREANKINQYLNTNLVFSREDTSDSPRGGIGQTQIRVVNTRHKMSTVWSVARFEEKLEQMRDIYNNDGDVSADDDDVFNDPEDVWEKDTSSLTLSASSPALGNSLNGVWRSPAWIKRTTPTPVCSRRDTPGLTGGNTSPTEEHSLISVFRNIFSMTGDVFSELTLKESIADKILMVCQRIVDNTNLVMEQFSNTGSNEGGNSCWMIPVFQMAADVQTLTSLTSSLCSSLSVSTNTTSSLEEFLMDLMGRLREAVKTIHHKGNALLQGCEGKISSLVSESGQKMGDTVVSLILVIGEMAMALGLPLVRLDHSGDGLSRSIKESFLSGASLFVTQSLDGGRTSLELLETKCDRLQESSLKQEDTARGEMCKRIGHVLSCTKSLVEKASDAQRQLESNHRDGSDEEDVRPLYYFTASYKRLQGLVTQTLTITDSCALLVQSAQAVVLGMNSDGKRLEKCARLVLSGCQRLMAISSSSSSSSSSTIGLLQSSSSSSLLRTPTSKPQSQSGSSVEPLNKGYLTKPSTDHDASLPMSSSSVSDFSSISSSFPSISSLSSCNGPMSNTATTNSNFNDSSNCNNSNKTSNEDVILGHGHISSSSSNTAIDIDQSMKQDTELFDVVLSQTLIESLEDVTQEVAMATVMFDEFLQKTYSNSSRNIRKNTSGNNGTVKIDKFAEIRGISTTPRGQRMLPASPKHKVVTMAGKEALFKKRERLAGFALAELGGKRISGEEKGLVEKDCEDQ